MVQHKPKSTNKQPKEEYNPSRPLKSVMQEMFVNNLLKGIVQHEAYKAAGYKTKNKDEQMANASRLKGNEKVSARIAYLRAGIEKRAEKTVDDVIREIEKVAFSNIQDFVGTDDDGNFVFRDWEGISRDKLAAVESVKVTKSTTRNKDDDEEYTTTNIQFKLASKLGALEDLAKRYNLFADNNINVNVVTIADIFARTGAKRLSGPIIDAPALPSGAEVGDMGDNASIEGKSDV